MNVLALILTLAAACFATRAQEPPRLVQAVEPAGLSAAEWKLVTDVVGSLEPAGRLALLLDSLPAHIEQLSLRRNKWQGEVPAGAIGWIAMDFRKAGLPVPDVIDDQVVNDIIWHYDNAYAGVGSGGTQRPYREVCVRALAYIGNPCGLPTLRHAVRDLHSITVWQAVAAMPHESLLPDVALYFAAGGDQNSIGVVRSLASLGDAALPVLRLILEAEEPDLRRDHFLEALSETLVAIGTEGSLQVLRRLEASLEPGRVARTVEWHALQLAASVEHDIWKPYPLTTLESYGLRRLCWMLLNDDPSVVREAQAVFISLGPKGLPVLRASLSSYSHADGPGGPHWSVTPHMAAVMVKIGDPAVPCLIEALTDQYSHVRASAGEALQELTGQELPSTFEVWAQWWEN